MSYRNFIKYVIFVCFGLSASSICLSSHADSPRIDRLELRRALSEQKKQEQMLDLDIEHPPVIDRNAIGPIGHYVERIDETHYNLYSYPKYYFGDDGRLTESRIQISNQPVGDYPWSMKSAVYHFLAKDDASFAVFHYGMWMNSSVTDIAYRDRVTGEMISLGWKRTGEKPDAVEGRRMVWNNIFDGVGLDVTLSEDYVKEDIILSQAARNRLPNPALLDFAPENTDLVIVYSFLIEDLNGKYELKRKGERVNQTSFAFSEGLQFSRGEKTPHVFPEDDAALPGFVDRYSTPDRLVPIEKYWHTDEKGRTMLAYGLPYETLMEAGKGDVVIDPTILFQEGVGEYSGSSLAVIYHSGSGNEDLNYGRDPVMKLAANSPVFMRIAAKFDLSGISSIDSSQIAGAKLFIKLKEIESNTYTGLTAKAYQITKSWNEGNGWGGIYTGGVTWNHAIYNTSAWTTSGAESTSGDRSSTYEDSVTLSTTAGGWEEWVTSDAVKYWLDHPSNNYGVLLRPDWSGYNTGFVYHSDDASNGSDRPYLQIDAGSGCNYGTPGVNEDYEFLGDSFSDHSDGVSFNISPDSWNSGDEVTMTWKLTTTNADAEAYYGLGQCLRMWIDLNGDCVFDGNVNDNDVEHPSDEEVQLKSSSGSMYPYVIESHDPYPCPSPGNQVGTFTITHADESFTFNYKFIVPELDFFGQITTKMRVYLRFAFWPPGNPYQMLTDGGGCLTEYGDYEDYEVTIRSNP